MNESVPDLVADAESIALEAQRTFGSLSPAQLNWKPGADAWSVAQCFDHLIRINSTYFPALRRIQEKGYTPGWRDRVPFLSRLIGSLVLKAVEPGAPRKFKAAAHVTPASSAIDGQIIERFVTHQQEVIRHMKQTAERGDLGGMIIVSPVASAAFYSVLDAFRIVVAHERRHMEQAGRVRRTVGFPAA
jgi:DinB superfamily